MKNSEKLVEGKINMKQPNSPGSHQDDLLSLENLRLSQDFAETVGVKKRIITVPVQKPDRQWFVRVHPDEAYRLPTAVLEIKEDRETYLVNRPLWTDLAEEITKKILLTSINRQGVVFLWPIKLPDADGRYDHWNQSALEIATQIATKKWVRVVSNRSLNGYEPYEATANLSEPEWPKLNFQELLNIAFKGRFVESLDHPVVRRLRGEM